jgi:hypothetical protein
MRRSLLISVLGVAAVALTDAQTQTSKPPTVETITGNRERPRRWPSSIRRSCAA